MCDSLISVGWALKSGDSVERREQQKNWYDKKRTATPAKIYKTKSVADRYGTPIEVFVKKDDL